MAAGIERLHALREMQGVRRADEHRVRLQPGIHGRGIGEKLRSPRGPGAMPPGKLLHPLQRDIAQADDFGLRVTDSRWACPPIMPPQPNNAKRTFSFAMRIPLSHKASCGKLSAHLA